MKQNLVWLSMLALMSTGQVTQAILNTTSVIVPPSGISIYPCLQLDKKIPDLEPAMMGQWYVIEIIQHRAEEKSQGTHMSDVCPKLNLYKTSVLQLKLLWHEKAGDVHYNFRISDPENSGFWMVWDKQSGSMLNKAYHQFLGSVQVLEAQPSLMVLNFCATNRTHYSVVMVRNITVQHDTREVHRLLENFGLKEYGVRLMCKDLQNPDSSASLSTPMLTIILSSVLLLISTCWQSLVV